MSNTCFAHTHSGSYTVQVATYRNVPSNFVESLNQYGKVHAIQAGELTRVSIGSFDSRDGATNLLNKLRNEGFDDAFINRLGASTSSHSHSKIEQSSEMTKFHSLSPSEQDQAVFLDGKLFLKQGERFIPVE